MVLYVMDCPNDFFSKYQDRPIFGSDNGWGDNISPGEKLKNSLENVHVIRTFLETEEEFSGWNMTLRGIKLDNFALKKSIFKTSSDM